MEAQHRQGRQQTQAYRDYRRDQIAGTVVDFDHVKHEQSLREFARQHEIPRSTLQGWLDRHARLNASPEAVAFFTCPAGVAFLHRLYLAIHLVLTVLCPAGVRKVCKLLELSGLNAFIADSYGANYRYAKALEQAIADFDDEQRPQLIEHMQRALALEGRERKPIIALEDETFHPACCLVAIEAASNFILLETYSERRDADTWTRHMNQALDGLPVEVVAACSDEGKGVKAHIERDLGAHHGTELFHVQHEITKGCSAALGRQVRTEADALDELRARLDRLPDDDSASPRQAAKREQLDRELEQARQRHEQACEHREQMRQARVGLSAAYHPYELDSGQARDAGLVARELADCFEQARAVADDAGLSQRAHKSIAKAARLKESMAGNVAFFHDFTAKRLMASGFEPVQQQWLREVLIPGAYLQVCAQRAASADERDALRQAAAQCRARLDDDVWQTLDARQRATLEAFAVESAGLFVRSDSAVEGRNGQLSLHHHGVHSLQPGKLRALTVVHNYFLRRGDGTTAAERFFGTPHESLFDDLLRRMPLPSWPAQKRSDPHHNKAAA